jgi:hypothetical protein
LKLCALLPELSSCEAWNRPEADSLSFRSHLIGSVVLFRADDLIYSINIIPQFWIREFLLIRSQVIVPELFEAEVIIPHLFGNVVESVGQLSCLLGFIREN